MEAISGGLFSRALTVVEDDIELTRINFPTWREGTEFTIGGHPYVMRRMGLFRGDLLLYSEGDVVASARHQGVFKTRYIIEYAGRTVELGTRRWFSRGFSVFVGEAEVGSITPTGWFRSRVIIDISDEIPLEVQVFLLCVAVVLWRRNR